MKRKEVIIIAAAGAIGLLFLMSRRGEAPGYAPAGAEPAGASTVETYGELPPEESFYPEMGLTDYSETGGLSPFMYPWTSPWDTSEPDWQPLTHEQIRNLVEEYNKRFGGVDNQKATGGEANQTISSQEPQAAEPEHYSVSGALKEGAAWAAGFGAASLAVEGIRRKFFTPRSKPVRISVPKTDARKLSIRRLIERNRIRDIQAGRLTKATQAEIRAATREAEEVAAKLSRAGRLSRLGRVTRFSRIARVARAGTVAAIALPYVINIAGEIRKEGPTVKAVSEGVRKTVKEEYEIAQSIPGLKQLSDIAFQAGQFIQKKFGIGGWW
ncbi:hypothetical protein [Archaeoglobus veneficus]|uniref:Uncharacterized protein n=1 Tax=Archaeoglobus veneficus (strain DSM 11195 / SNP6) TaxID=693661 RepID=F2KR61_ARCVS|nr:hypothetical protein [Archaeoglobus veneficus]AEA46698.1 hypothetical protein Arcve_0678 [Archaeoglobus veneficus SNP6]